MLYVLPTQNKSCLVLSCLALNILPTMLPRPAGTQVKDTLQKKLAVELQCHHGNLTDSRSQLETCNIQQNFNITMETEQTLIVN